MTIEGISYVQDGLFEIDEHQPTLPIETGQVTEASLSKEAGMNQPPLSGIMELIIKGN